MPPGERVAEAAVERIRAVRLNGAVEHALQHEVSELRFRERFGKWREIIAQDMPADRDLYCNTVAMMHYAKGIAHAALGDVTRAVAEQFGARRGAVEAALLAGAVSAAPGTGTGDGSERGSGPGMMRPRTR